MSKGSAVLVSQLIREKKTLELCRELYLRECSFIVRQSCSHESQGLSILAYDDLPISSDDDIVTIIRVFIRNKQKIQQRAFDKWSKNCGVIHDYRRDARIVLCRPLGDDELRTELEIAILYKWATKHSQQDPTSVTSFISGSCSKTNIIKALQHLRLECYCAYDVITFQGDEANSAADGLFTVFAGSCEVVQLQANSTHLHQLKVLVRGKLWDQASELLRKYGRSKATLRHNAGFGVNDTATDAKRRISVRASEEGAEVLVIPKSCYAKLLSSNAQLHVSTEVMELLRQVGMAYGMSSKELFEISISFVKRVLTIGEVLYCKNEPVDHVYIVASGEILLDTGDNEVDKKIEPFVAVNSDKCYILSAQSILGDEGFTGQQACYESTAVCMSEMAVIFEPIGRALEVFAEGAGAAKFYVLVHNKEKSIPEASTGVRVEGVHNPYQYFNSLRSLISTLNPSRGLLSRAYISDAGETKVGPSSLEILCINRPRIDPYLLASSEVNNVVMSTTTDSSSFSSTQGQSQGRQKGKKNIVLSQVSPSQLSPGSCGLPSSPSNKSESSLHPSPKRPRPFSPYMVQPPLSMAVLDGNYNDHQNGAMCKNWRSSSTLLTRLRDNQSGDLGRYLNSVALKHANDAAAIVRSRVNKQQQKRLQKAYSQEENTIASKRVPNSSRASAARAGVIEKKLSRLLRSHQEDLKSRRFHILSVKADLSRSDPHASNDNMTAFPFLKYHLQAAEGNAVAKSLDMKSFVKLDESNMSPSLNLSVNFSSGLEGGSNKDSRSGTATGGARDALLASQSHLERLGEVKDIQPICKAMTPSIISSFGHKTGSHKQLNNSQPVSRLWVNVESGDDDSTIHRVGEKILGLRSRSTSANFVRFCREDRRVQRGFFEIGRSAKDLNRERSWRMAQSHKLSIHEKMMRGCTPDPDEAEWIDSADELFPTLKAISLDHRRGRNAHITKTRFMSVKVGSGSLNYCLGAKDRVVNRLKKEGLLVHQEKVSVARSLGITAFTASTVGLVGGLVVNTKEQCGSASLSAAPVIAVPPDELADINTLSGAAVVDDHTTTAERSVGKLILNELGTASAVEVGPHLYLDIAEAVGAEQAIGLNSLSVLASPDESSEGDAASVRFLGSGRVHSNPNLKSTREDGATRRPPSEALDQYFAFAQSEKSAGSVAQDRKNVAAQSRFRLNVPKPATILTDSFESLHFAKSSLANCLSSANNKNKSDYNYKPAPATSVYLRHHKSASLQLQRRLDRAIDAAEELVQTRRGALDQLHSRVFTARAAGEVSVGGANSSDAASAGDDADATVQHELEQWVDFSVSSALSIKRGERSTFPVLPLPLLDYKVRANQKTRRFGNGQMTKLDAESTLA